MKKEKVLSQIKSKKFSGKNRRLVVARLSDIYGLTFAEMDKLVFDLEKDGSLFVDNKNNVH